jgi:histidine triad (HIT) family protein
MATIFTKIINGEIPAYKIAEDENYLAFLDINPLKLGHALAIPKKEVDYIFDLDDETLAGLSVFAKKVARGIEKVVTCKRVAVLVLGLEVPHAHIHLIPLDQESDTHMKNPRVKLSKDEFEEITKKISEAIEI